MSYTEKSAWVQLVASGLGLVAYAVPAVSKMLKGEAELGPYIPIIVVAVLLVMAVNITGHVVTAMAGGEDPTDERDRVIAQRAEVKAGVFLRAGVAFALTGMLVSMSPLTVVHALLLTLFGAELTAVGYRLTGYRRGH